MTQVPTENSVIANLEGNAPYDAWSTESDAQPHRGFAKYSGDYCDGTSKRIQSSPSGSDTPMDVGPSLPMVSN